MTTTRRSARLNNPITPSLDAPSYYQRDDDHDDHGPTTTTAAMPPPPSSGAKVVIDVVRAEGGEGGTAGRRRAAVVVVAPPPKEVAVENDSDNDEEDEGDSDSESESGASDLLHPTASRPRRRPARRTTLREEVEYRRTRLARLLRGREGTAYADAILGREDIVNSRLLLLLLDGESSSSSPTPPPPASPAFAAARRPPPPAEPTTTMRRRVGGGATMMIRCALLEEWNHALPAAFSLVVHCVLYYQFYAMISTFADWLCYCPARWQWYAGGGGGGGGWWWWDADKFYASALFLSVLAGRVTGTLYDWNDNAPYRMLIDMQLRNRWVLRSWDARLMNYFSGDAIRSRYEREVDNAVPPIRVGRVTRWGPGAKRVLDLISFFLCYKSVEHFLWRVGPSSTTPPPPPAMVNDGAPRPPGRGGGRRSSSSSSSSSLSSSSSSSRGRRRVSHECTAVVGALGNPYASAMLDWIASRAAESAHDDVVARGYVANAMNCGWSGPRTTTTRDDDGDRPWTYYDGNDENTDSSSEFVEANDDESDRPTMPIAEGGNTIAPPDDDYDESRNIVPAAGEPIPGPVDWLKEQLFVFASTAICLGLLYACGIPFLLI